MTFTGIIVIGCFIALGIYDLIVVLRKGVGCSVSRFLQRSALKSPIFTFCIGAVAGHIFGYMAPEPIPVDIEAICREHNLVKLPPGTDCLVDVPIGYHCLLYKEGDPNYPPTPPDPPWIKKKAKP